MKQGLDGDTGDLGIRPELGTQTLHVEPEPLRVHRLRVEDADADLVLTGQAGRLILQQLGGPKVRGPRALGTGLVHLPFVLEEQQPGAGEQRLEVRRLLGAGGGEVQVAAPEDGDEREGQVVGRHRTRREAEGDDVVDPAALDVLGEIARGQR